MNEEDRLAGAVGAVMKEEDSMDAQLEKYARGALSEAERSALEAQAEQDPQLKAALELYAPLSSTLKQQLVELGQEASQPEKVVELNARRSKWIGGALAAAAAAVVLALIFRPGGQRVLPEYALSARAGDAVVRSAAAEKHRRLRADSELELILKPAQPIDPQAIDAVLYAAGEKSAAKPEISGDGAVRWIGRAEELAGARTGTVAMTMIVGLRGRLPSAANALNPADPAWHAETFEVVIVPR